MAAGKASGQSEEDFASLTAQEREALSSLDRYPLPTAPRPPPCPGSARAPSAFPPLPCPRLPVRRRSRAALCPRPPAAPTLANAGASLSPLPPARSPPRSRLFGFLRLHEDGARTKALLLKVSARVDVERGWGGGGGGGMGSEVAPPPLPPGPPGPHGECVPVCRGCAGGTATSAGSPRLAAAFAPFPFYHPPSLPRSLPAILPERDEGGAWPCGVPVQPRDGESGGTRGRERTGRGRGRGGGGGEAEDEEEEAAAAGGERAREGGRARRC